MSDIDSAPMLVYEALAVEASRHGRPLRLSAQQRERIRRGFEALVREGLAFDDVDVADRSPCACSCRSASPGPTTC